MSPQLEHPLCGSVAFARRKRVLERVINLFDTKVIIHLLTQVPWNPRRPRKKDLQSSLDLLDVLGLPFFFFCGALSEN